MFHFLSSFALCIKEEAIYTSHSRHSVPERKWEAHPSVAARLPRSLVWVLKLKGLKGKTEAKRKHYWFFFSPAQVQDLLRTSCILSECGLKALNF